MRPTESERNRSIVYFDESDRDTLCQIVCKEGIEWMDKKQKTTINSSSNTQKAPAVETVEAVEIVEAVVVGFAA